MLNLKMIQGLSTFCECGSNVCCTTACFLSAPALFPALESISEPIRRFCNSPTRCRVRSAGPSAVSPAKVALTFADPGTALFAVNSSGAHCCWWYWSFERFVNVPRYTATVMRRESVTGFLSRASPPPSSASLFCLSAQYDGMKQESVPSEQAQSRSLSKPL